MPADSSAPLSAFAWFAERYGQPTPAQKAAWPRIARGENILLSSPTGTGKTFAAFLGVLEEFRQLHAQGALRDTIHCVYVSPLRALSYDLEKNLREPLRELFGEKPPIRVELRSGDTTSSQRARQYTKPPHILLTTPESLCVLLSQEKWLTHLASVRWLIVDEIHALAENKRGAHLALSIERLAHHCGKLQRIGLSATIAPLEEVARFLVGTPGQCAILDVSSSKKVKLSVHTPLRKNPYPEAGYTGQRMIRELGNLIRKHRTTLVFCNVRSGAEATTYWLRENFPDLAEVIECHHASLERDVRREVEDRLKRGELRAVVCSTSLEMGIDIGSVDLVVMMSTPKGVSKALQRAGRAGHNIRSVSRGILMATNLSDLVESCATVLLSRERQLDHVRLPECPLDVLAQHLVSMGCTARWTRAAALALIRRAYPFRDLDEAMLNEVLDYLAGGGASLRERYSEVFGKIQLDAESFRTREGRVRRDFLQNIGVIPNVGQVHVRTKNKFLGSVEESFIRQLKIGDVFMISGRPVRLEKVTQMEAWVTRADGALPTVPRWNANKMPLSNRVAQEINAFRRELRAGFIEERADLAKWIARRLDCGRANAEIILKTHQAQHDLSEIPTADFLLVEELDDEKQNALHYFFHSLIGRAANDALARVVTRRLSESRGGNAIATPHDYGFVLTVARRQRFTEAELPKLLRLENFDHALDEALRQSEMLKYHFRNAAQTGLMVYRNYFDQHKSVRKLQWSSEVIFNVLREHEPEHVLLREARRDALHTFIDADGARDFLLAQAARPLRLRRVAKVPPLSFAMYATKIKEALLVEDPYETMERLYHQWWSEIENGSPPSCLEPGVWLDAERAVWLEEWRTLAVADLHLGYAWAHRAEGQLLPIDTREDSTERLLKLLDRYPAEEVVLLGDIVHRAVDVPALHTELRWLALNVGERARLRLIGGNHDRELAATLATAGIVLEIDDHATVGPHLLLHGDERDEALAASRLREHAALGGRVILGHEHPAIGLSDGVASHVKCPCFVSGPHFLVLPAFSRWAAGGDIRSHRFMSPYARLHPAEKALAIVAGKLLPIPLPKR